MANVKKPSKQELFQSITNELEAVFVQLKVDGKAKAAISDIVSKYMKPKASGFGQKADLDAITKRDANGKIVEILCSISNKWLPATSEFFYSETKGEGIGGTGFRRGSKPGEATLKAFKRDQFKKQQELIASSAQGKLSTDQLAAELKKLEAQKVDFSGVTKDYFKAKEAAKATEAAAKAAAKEIEAATEVGPKPSKPTKVK